MKVELTVVKGPQRGRVFEFLEERGFVIGRGREADVSLADDPYVSRRHVYLEICPPRCRLLDLGSTNPTRLNGEPAFAQELHDGDLLDVGYTQLRLSITETAAPVVTRCRGCGSRVEVLEGETPPERCAVCVPTGLASMPHVPRSPTPRCHQCGAEVPQAPEDAASSLGDVAVYSCAGHLAPNMIRETRIRDYELVRPLGEGAMGLVYLAYHRASARLWAIKQIRDLSHDVLVKRFQREVQLMQEIVHANVVRCVETGIDDDGLPFLVSEYVPDGSLEELVEARGGRLPVAEAVRLASGVLDGLEYLHGRGVVHRDIKPGNILLRGRDAASVPKLADFGIAKSYARAGGTWRTSPGARLGTLMFMPPEQVLDAARVDETADLYALGVTLYYLLTGSYSLDFPSPGEAAALHQQRQGLWSSVDVALRALVRFRQVKHPYLVILQEEPVPIRERDPRIPARLAAVVDRAVRKDPGRRFASAGEFRSQLEDAWN